MPQKTRSQKERTAERRESGRIKPRVAPAPIELQTPETGSGIKLNVPAAPVRRTPASAATLARNSEGEFNYKYVYADLRRIALLAILCFGVMFVLAFVIR